MNKRTLGKTNMQIAPLVLGGNVFGWTIDEKKSFEVLDSFIDYGFNAIDTADVYSLWAPGNKGGESETIIGNWLKTNPGKRDKVLLFTKVGSDMEVAGHNGLTEEWIIQAVEDSLHRLQTDVIDLYFSHWPDKKTPYEETLGAYEKLLKAGKIRHIGASNLNAQQLSQALAVSKEKNLPRYDVLEPEYNLYDRSDFDGSLRELCIKENLGVIAYYSLASGFLTGKYRTLADLKQSKRGVGIEKYMTKRGLAILQVLDEVSIRLFVSPAEVALAWVMKSAGVTAPIASATNCNQVRRFSSAVNLKLSDEDFLLLDKASTL